MTSIIPKRIAFPPRRRGSVYVFVLGAGMLLAVAGMAMLASSQISLRSAVAADDAAEAAVLAESAVEYALARIKSNANWRTSYTNNVEITPVPFGRGTLSFKLVDEADGSLSNNTGDAVRVYGIGRVGKSARCYSVSCGQQPLSSLTVPVAAGGNITFSATGYTMTGSATVSSNGNISASTGSFAATNFEAAGTISLGTANGTGTRRAGISAKELPASASVFNWYVANGTTVTGMASPLTVSARLFSPASNPFGGGTNSRGIYVINCNGAAITFNRCRIVGTIVLLNCGGCTVQGESNWEPAEAGMPVLLVQGNLTWSPSTALLSEGGSPAVNFNPASTPYPYNGGAGGGTSNATTSNTYPNQVSGLIYCTNTFTTTASPNLVDGVIVAGGAWSASGSISLTHTSTYSSDPPPGFTSASPAPANGTWKWEQVP